jgi:hypothetical protein
MVVDFVAIDIFFFSLVIFHIDNINRIDSNSNKKNKNMRCEKCSKELDVEKEGNKLCLSCQTDYVNKEWKIKIKHPEKYETSSKRNN